MPAGADDPRATTESASPFQLVLNHLEGEILAGRVPDGSRLPTERELAEQLGVSRGAVREAIRVLQAQGILVSAVGPGRGTRVQAGHVDAIGRILRLHLSLKSVSFADLTETRVALERSAIESAARRRRPEPLARAADLHREMERTSSPEGFNQLDTDFHNALAEAGDNQLVSDLTVAIRSAVHQPILTAESELEDWPDFHAGLVAQHAGILDAVQAGDAALAGERVADHIRHSYRRLLAGHGEQIR